MMKSLLIGVALLASLVGATIADAAVSRVASRAVTKECVGSFNTCDIVYPNDLTAGNLAVIGGGLWQSGGTTLTVTGCGITFQVFHGTVIDSGFRSWVAMGIVTSSGACTLTVNGANADDWGSFSADEFTKAAGQTFALDIDGGSSTGTSTTAADSLTTITANALILGAMTNNGTSTTLTPTANYTQIGEIESSTNTPHNFVFRIATTATAYTVDWTLSSSRVWSVQTIAVKEIPEVSGCTGGLLLMGAGGC